MRMKLWSHHNPVPLSPLSSCSVGHQVESKPTQSSKFTTWSDADDVTSMLWFTWFKQITERHKQHWHRYGKAWLTHSLTHISTSSDRITIQQDYNHTVTASGPLSCPQCGHLTHAHICPCIPSQTKYGQHNDWQWSQWYKWSPWFKITWYVCKISKQRHKNVSISLCAVLGVVRANSHLSAQAADALTLCTELLLR